jgi:DNA-directed RNA polymerase subunit M/transcription elongation factor TFIIS
MNLDMTLFACSKCAQILPVSAKVRGRTNVCKQCRTTYMREYRVKNLEKVKEHEARGRAKRKDAHRVYVAIWYKKNAEKIKLASRLRYQQIKTNPLEKLARQKWRLKNIVKTREYTRMYRQRHKDRVAAIVQGRNARKRQARPVWANEAKIRVLYRTAYVLTKIMKRRFEVDHIYPLSSPFMCGLHVETNLRVISREENMQKSNRHWPGQLHCQTGPVFDP